MIKANYSGATALVFILCLFLFSCKSEPENTGENTGRQAGTSGTIHSYMNEGSSDDQDDFPAICSLDSEVPCGETIEDCADLSSSVRHCGECGRRCFSKQECDEGACTGVGVLSSYELKKALENKDFLLVNLRVAANDLIPGTDATVPHDRIDLMKEIIGEDRERKTVLYCGTLCEVELALSLLRGEGYTNISVLEDGVQGWRSAGYPMEAGISIQ